MSTLTALRGLVLGMEIAGAKFVKTDGFHVFFDIPKNSEINDDVKLNLAKEAFKKTLGLGLKIRRI